MCIPSQKWRGLTKIVKILNCIWEMNRDHGVSHSPKCHVDNEDKWSIKPISISYFSSNRSEPIHPIPWTCNEVTAILFAKKWKFYISQDWVLNLPNSLNSSTDLGDLGQKLKIFSDWEEFLYIILYIVNILQFAEITIPFV